MVFFFFEQVDNSIFEFSPKIFYAFPVAHPFLLQLLLAEGGLCRLRVSFPQVIGYFNFSVLLLEFLAIVFVVAVTFQDKSDTRRVGWFRQLFDMSGSQMLRWIADPRVQASDIFRQLDKMPEL